jgi:acetyl esterase/lipase
MKTTLQSILAIAIISIGIDANAQTRYLDDVFSTVTVTSDVVYANNISILPALQGLPPAPTDLTCDIYEPSGDTELDRPVIILAHTGSFLPPVLNGQPTGSKTDSSVVEQCMRWAKKGYVAVAMTYRLGWNPSSTDQNTRTSTLIQAAYRSIQDARSLIRFIRKDEANGDPYGVDGSKIVFGGQGTGGYLSLGVATLDTSSELYLSKFLDFTDPMNPTPYVYPPVFGNIWGTDMGYIPVTDTAGNYILDSLGNPIMAPFALPNNVGYSSDISLAFNIGGALADISWLEEGDAPIVAFHCEKDQYAPIDTGDVIVPTTGDFVVEVMGSRTVVNYSNTYGNNDVFVQAGFTDAFTTAANINNSGYEGLNVFNTPSPSTTPNLFGEAYEEEGSPWDWWDNATYDAIFQAVQGAPAGYGAANSILGNPDMSATKGNLYIDTIQGYLNPRIYVALGLGISTGMNEVIDASTEIYPNPANNSLNIVSYAAGINSVKIYNLNGQEVLNTKVNANQIKINTSRLANGLYILDIKYNNTSVKRKLIIE